MLSDIVNLMKKAYIAILTLVLVFFAMTTGVKADINIPNCDHVDWTGNEGPFQPTCDYTPIHQIYAVKIWTKAYTQNINEVATVRIMDYNGGYNERCISDPFTLNSLEFSYKYITFSNCIIDSYNGFLSYVSSTVNGYVYGGAYGKLNTGPDIVWYFSENALLESQSTSTAFIDTQLNIASTTDVTLTYYVNAIDLASSTANGGILRFHSYVNGLDTGWQSTSTDISITTSGIASTTYQVALQHAGLYHLYASIYALDSYGSIGQVYTSTTTDFTFISDYYTSIFGTTTPQDQGIPYEPCNALHVYGCIQNAFVYLFYPSSDSIGIQMFNEFKIIMYKKPPIGYFSMIKQAMNTVSASSTGAITGWIIPQGIITAFFTPVSTAVTGILGFFILIQFYKRFKDVDLKG